MSWPALLPELQGLIRAALSVSGRKLLAMTCTTERAHDAPRVSLLQRLAIENEPANARLVALIALALPSTRRAELICTVLRMRSRGPVRSTLFRVLTDVRPADQPVICCPVVKEEYFREYGPLPIECEHHQLTLYDAVNGTPTVRHAQHCHAATNYCEGLGGGHWTCRDVTRLNCRCDATIVVCRAGPHLPANWRYVGGTRADYPDCLASYLADDKALSVPTEWNIGHIALVLEQVPRASRAQAAAALTKTRGDIVNAIMELTLDD